MRMLRTAWALVALLATSLPSVAAITTTRVGNAAYTITNTDVSVVTTAAFTAGRTWTLPSPAGTCIGQNCQPPQYQLQIMDLAGAFSQQFPLTIGRPSGVTINGLSADLIISGTGARVLLIPTDGNNWNSYVVGDYVTSGLCKAPAATATVTITIAAPGVITWATHGMTGACPVVFTTTSALPTGITSGTVYYIVPSSITTNTFSIATTVANALAGTKITTSGSQGGVQTGTAGVALSTGTAADVTGVSLSQGDWDCRSKISRTLGASTSVTVLTGGNSTTSATAATQGTNAATTLSTAANVMGAGGTDSTMGPDRQSTTATTNLFLVAQDTFTVSTNVAYGAMTCRRMR